MIVTTTNSIESAEVIRYIDLVTSNVVIGTNFFSDLGASLTDFFGGVSETYQGKLQKLYSMAIYEIKDRAKKIGANAVIGLKVDFDEISGKGKSMFMISAIGTAVVLSYSKSIAPIAESNEISSISADKLVKEIIKKELVERIKSNERLLIGKDYWDYLLNNPIEEISNELLNTYLAISSNQSGKSQHELLFLSNFTIYLSNLNREFVQDFLYARYLDNPDTILGFITQLNLFNPRKVLELVDDGKLDESVSCLQVNKDFFTEDDCFIMEKIISSFNNLPDKGKIEVAKAFMLKPKDIYICPKGHSNNIDDVYCANCGKNIKGLNKTQVGQIEKFKKKTEILKNLINNKQI